MPNPAPQQTIKIISVEQLHALSQRQPVEVIDVRTPSEFNAQRATLARNVPLDELDPHAVMSGRENADEPLYIICQIGGRSAYACAVFMAAGYPNVVNVDGGTDAWVARGLSTIRS